MKMSKLEALEWNAGNVFLKVVFFLLICGVGSIQASADESCLNLEKFFAGKSQKGIANNWVLSGVKFHGSFLPAQAVADTFSKGIFLNPVPAAFRNEFRTDDVSSFSQDGCNSLTLFRKGLGEKGPTIFYEKYKIVSHSSTKLVLRPVSTDYGPIKNATDETIERVTSSGKDAIRYTAESTSPYEDNCDSNWDTRFHDVNYTTEYTLTFGPKESDTGPISSSVMLQYAAITESAIEEANEKGRHCGGAINTSFSAGKRRTPPQDGGSGRGHEDSRNRKEKEAT